MESNNFKNIAGYNSVKKELNDISRWYQRDNKLSNKEIKMPIGFIFHGPTGTGKSKFVSEFAKLFNYKKYYLTGEKENSCEELISLFNEASQNEKAIIVIDELDLYLEKDRKLSRVLQTELDKAYENGNILVFATTNNMHLIPRPLLRCGRFERKYEIGTPNQDDRNELIKYFLLKLDLDPNQIDTLYLAKIINNASGALIQTIIHDAYTRFNGEITTEAIEESYYYIEHGLLYDEEQVTYNKDVTAIHEIGHAVIAYKNKEYYNFYKAYLHKSQGARGMCKIFPTHEDDDNINKTIAQIEIALGGYVANNYINKIKTEGAYDDLIKANKLSRLVINVLGYKGLKYILKKYYQNERNETDFNCYRNEKLATKLLLKCERNVKKYIKKN